MSIIQAVIGSIQGANSPVLHPISTNYGAYPGYGNPSASLGSTVGAQGTAYDPGGNVSSIGPGVVITGHLIRRYYNGFWANNGSNNNDNPSVFDGTLIDAVNDPYIAFNSQSTQDVYAMEWKGYWQCPATGDWNFSCYADDIAWIWLGSAALSPDSSNALCKTNTCINSVQLTAGQYYPIRIRYQEWYGGESLGVFAGMVGTDPEALFVYPDRMTYNGSSDGY